MMSYYHYQGAIHYPGWIGAYSNSSSLHVLSQPPVALTKYMFNSFMSRLYSVWHHCPDVMQLKTMKKRESKPSRIVCKIISYRCIILKISATHLERFIRGMWLCNKLHLDLQLQPMKTQMFVAERGHRCWWVECESQSTNYNSPLVTIKIRRSLPDAFFWHEGFRHERAGRAGFIRNGIILSVSRFIKAQQYTRE